jgi:hypothetical protein
MVHLKPGFILIEVLVSFAIVTTCIVLFMRSQAQGLALQAYALKIMACIDRINEILDTTSDLSNKNVAICNGDAKVAVFSISQPVMSTVPEGLSCKDSSRMKVVTVSVVCTKDGQDEAYCIPTIIAGKDHV